MVYVTVSRLSQRCYNQKSLLIGLDGAAHIWKQMYAPQGCDSGRPRMGVSVIGLIYFYGA